MKPTKFVIPGRLKYTTGDATIPEAAGHRLIIHVCNDVGAWGAGFVLAVSKRWKKPEEEYKRWFRGSSAFGSAGNFKLGNIQSVDVQSDTAVVNMIAQVGLYKKDEEIPLRYDALETCLDKVGELALQTKSSIHAPRFGAGLAGGDWQKIETLIVERLIRRGINVTIYDLEAPAETKTTKFYSLLEDEVKEKKNGI